MPAVSEAALDPELREGLAMQDRLVRNGGGPVPGLAWDYVLVEAHGDGTAGAADALAALQRAPHAGMVRPFLGTRSEARALAFYAIFTDFYAIELWGGYARIVRLRDDTVVTRSVTAPDYDELVADFPYRDPNPRAGVTSASDAGCPLAVTRDRGRSATYSAGNWTPVPCSPSVVGECFEDKRCMQ
jgi:hypothetical protein